ncbi:hypothetical protein BDM02DRAFT_3266009 [Thelephora ganbajun]|uniref:Uncharacterized protein n=1 Tax=Thelephora ganbajun TaxID=370292 RepID=A0ACB6ZUL6_THEGA|nr:hypothetical protein BDM02DRAFT_3266009 [Thelephora ganbajun]
MSQYTTSRGQKRKPEDGQGSSGHPDKRLREENGSGHDPNGELYWVVQWRSPQHKKHKTWDGDGVLIVRGLTYFKLLSQSSITCEMNDVPEHAEPNNLYTRLASGPPNPIPTKLESGTCLKWAEKEAHLDFPITHQDFLSGKHCSPIHTGDVDTASVRASAPSIKQFVPPKQSRPFIGSSSIQKKSISLHPVNLIKSPTNPVNNALSSKKSLPDSYWSAQWRKPQQKKHRTWDGDGFVTCTEGGLLRLASESGKILGTKKADKPPVSGQKLFIGTREVELELPVTQSELPMLTGTDLSEQEAFDPEEISSATPRDKNDDQKTDHSSDTTVASQQFKTFIPPTSFYAKTPENKEKREPLHDPDAENAVVMVVPTKEHETKFNPKKLDIVPVVIDPILSRKLRSHQIEGVKFLYECVMGYRGHGGRGCILADEMGLGKTLQTVTLIWTLLRQNPYAAPGPVIRKALIVCPVSLINNWRSEFHKWLGRDRVSILTGDKDKSQIKLFLNSKHQVLIIGYEKLRSIIEDLSYCQPPIGLIICDEGHRLKSANNKTSRMFDALKTPRRIILSGTPIQNDLGEFHAMAEFCNPGLLDDYSAFRKKYENPILKSRTPRCTTAEAKLGTTKLKELLHVAQSFVLRREANLLKKYLPPKYEYVVFITPTRVQIKILMKILTKDNLDPLIKNSMTDSLALMGLLQKICNSPILLKATVDKNKGKGNQDANAGAVLDALVYLPARPQVEDVSLSGKLTALASLLNTISKGTDEKVVIVSHWTSTLNIIEAYCKKRSYTYHRLDGSTPSQKRQEYVNDFNKASQASRFLFLLSSKAGGVGINLIGASRLCLIDGDWNPSHDLQSMARIHRDGQKRPVFIYRFLTAGTIDEKIFQRQVTKLGLSASVMGMGAAELSSDSFTTQDLRDIFTFHPHTGCHTHELLDCPCVKGDTGEDDSGLDTEEEEAEMMEAERRMLKGFVTAASLSSEDYVDAVDKSYALRKKAQLAALGEWTHINGLRRGSRDRVQDEVLQSLMYGFDPERSQQSRSDALSAIDSSTTEIPVDQVPGGTVSFIFERFSATIEKEDDGEPGDGGSS